MVAYSFQRQFIGPIEGRSKGQTIRAQGKRRHAWAGCQLQLYFAARMFHACQQCHNRYDAPMRRAGIRQRQHQAAGQAELGLNEYLSGKDT